jgi:hypothetical protein
MTRRLYVWREGEFVEIGGTASESKSASVHQDTISALKHPVTGKVYESKSAYLKDLKRDGLTVVGNDLLSKKKQVIPDRITEEMILDKIERAESIVSDPFKLSQERNRNIQLFEQRERLLYAKQRN